MMRSVFGREAMFSVAALLISAILIQTIYATVIRPRAATILAEPAVPQSQLKPGQPVTRNQIVEEIWKRNAEGVTNIVDVYINYLRLKIDRGFENSLIRTVHGVGYMIGNSSKRNAA